MHAALGKLEGLGGGGGGGGTGKFGGDDERYFSVAM